MLSEGVSPWLQYEFFRARPILQPSGVQFRDVDFIA